LLLFFQIPRPDVYSISDHFKIPETGEGIIIFAIFFFLSILIFFFKCPKLMGITGIKYPTPHGFGLVGAGSLGGWKYNLHGLFTFGKELRATRYTAPRPEFQLSIGTTICFKFYLFIYFFGVMRGVGEENVTQRWGSRGAFEF